MAVIRESYNWAWNQKLFLYYRCLNISGVFQKFYSIKFPLEYSGMCLFRGISVPPSLPLGMEGEFELLAESVRLVNSCKVDRRFYKVKLWVMFQLIQIYLMMINKKAVKTVFYVKHILISFEMRERWLLFSGQMIGSEVQSYNGIGCG